MNILQEADQIIHGDRNKYYGHPLDNHSCTAKMWNAYIHRRFGGGVELTSEDVCWLNILQKVSREANLHKLDNAVDVCGYAGNVEMIKDEKKAREAVLNGDVPLIQ